MTFTVRTPDQYIHGLTANNYYDKVHENHAHLFAYYNAPVFFATNLLIEVGDTTMRDYCVFWVPKNLDNNAIKVYVRASISGGNDEGLVKLIETTTSTGSAATIPDDQSDVTEVGNPFDTITLTPTGTADGREFKLQAKCKNAGDTMTIHSVFAFYAGSGAINTAGLQTSGFRTTEATNIYAATYMISTEFMESLMNGPKKISIDRPACLMCSVGDLYRTPRISTTSTVYETVDQGLLPVPDHHGAGRKYKAYVYMSADGGATPALKIGLPGYDGDIEVAGTGWSSVEFTLHNPNPYAAKLLPYTVSMKRTGGTRAKLNTIQIFRSV